VPWLPGRLELGAGRGPQGLELGGLIGVAHGGELVHGQLNPLTVDLLLELGTLGAEILELPFRLQGSLTLGGGVEFVLERQFTLHPLHGVAVGLILRRMGLRLGLRSPGLGLSLKPMPMPMLMLVVEDGETSPRQHHGSHQHQPISVLPICEVVHTTL